MNSAAGDMAKLQQTIIAGDRVMKRPRQRWMKRAGFEISTSKVDHCAFPPFHPTHTFRD
jgi:hypothetical protein